MIELKGANDLIIAKFNPEIEHGTQPQTALERYTQWCSELGLSGNSRGSFDADDNSWVINTDSIHNYQGVDLIQRFNFSSEAGFGMYGEIPTNTGSKTASVPNVSRMYCSNTSPLLFFTYHWTGADLKSYDTQWKGNANGFCIFAKHSYYGGSTYQYHVAIKVSPSGISFYFEKVVDGTIPLYANTSNGSSWINQYLIATIFEGGASRTSVVLRSQSFVPQGSMVFDAGNIVESVRLLFTKEEPDGTNLKIEVSSDGTNWIEKHYGDILASGNILLKATLTTIDATITPVLKDIALQSETQPQDKILLNMLPLKRFHNVEGNLTVIYDKTKGNLAGLGGAIESFETQFLPTELMQFPNPYEDDKFNLLPIINLSFIKVQYTNRYGEHKFVITPICEMVFTFVGIVNP